MRVRGRNEPFVALSAFELKTDLPQYGLHQGAKGTVVMVHGQGEGYEVEFFDPEGDTLAIATCLASQIRRRKSATKTKGITTRAVKTEPTDKRVQSS